MAGGKCRKSLLARCRLCRLLNRSKPTGRCDRELLLSVRISRFFKKPISSGTYMWEQIIHDEKKVQT